MAALVLVLTKKREQSSAQAVYYRPHQELLGEGRDRRSVGRLEEGRDLNRTAGRPTDGRCALSRIGREEKEESVRQSAPRNRQLNCL